MRLKVGSLIAPALMVAAAHANAASSPQASTSCPDFRISTNVPGPPSKRAAFTAVVSGPANGLTYAWAISAGKIVRGQHKAMLFVEGTGKITATLTLGGLPASCKKTDSATVEIK